VLIIAPAGRKFAKKVGDAFDPERAPQKSEDTSGRDFQLACEYGMFQDFAT
jgi:hypothetical protein